MSNRSLGSVPSQSTVSIADSSMNNSSISVVSECGELMLCLKCFGTMLSYGHSSCVKLLYSLTLV